MSQCSLPKIIAVVGPTGSGKSQLALDLARTFGGEIICTDSMQVYQKLNIGTAKPTVSEQAEIPHHQLDLVPPDGHYSVGQYEKDVDRVLAQLHQKKKPPILVGGSGLYFRCTLFGICQIPEISLEIKQQIETWYTQGLRVCYQKLQQLDPIGASQLHPHDTARILRALQVFLSSGKSIQSYQQAHGFNVRKYSILSLGYRQERKQLYEQINQRTHQMLAEGFVEEVQTLLQEYPPTLKSLQAIGYRQVVQFLTNQLTQEEMILEIQQKTRNYAKRQITWFKKDPAILWFTKNEHSQILKMVSQFLRQH